MGRLFNFDLSYYIKQYNISHFIETGTGEGDTLAAILQYGLKEYHSVEINEIIYNKCKQRFHNISPNLLKLYNNNSYEALKEILFNIPKDKNIIFWLDAHFPGADSHLSAYGSEANDSIRIPLESEIELIANIRKGCKDLIFIDDLRIYEDGPFTNGNWEHRSTLGGNGIDFIYNNFSNTHTVARDYNDEGYILLTPKIELPQVTLVCVEGTDKEDNIINAINALRVSAYDINFKEILLISPTLPVELPENIQHQKINKLTWNEYNQFVISKLHRYINTEYCILIQTDGFIINPHLWDDKFLDYDYIGAAWDFKKYPFQTNSINPEVIKRKGIDGLNRVGNGGFTLRSKKLLEIASQCLFECNSPEDVFICNDFYDYFIEQGIKFAPPEIANIFSKDPISDTSSTFGFHGDKNLLNKII